MIVKKCISGFVQKGVKKHSFYIKLFLIVVSSKRQDVTGNDKFILQVGKKAL